ncbi:hypothetical protein BJY00DRAFT_297177 [Aspergillus carlsbadensis]|nr:hypothetical protein BJY00DRAFT_297177 [Aspergillus carlsbadensis]
MTRQALATTSNHPVLMNYSHGYGMTARVRVVKFQWPSKVWTTGRATTKQVQLRGIGVFCEDHPSDADDDRNGKIGPTKHLSNESKGVFSDILGPNVPIASRQLVEDSQVFFSGCRDPQPVIETTLCSPSVSVKASQSKEARAQGPLNKNKNHSKSISFVPKPQRNLSRC